MDRYLSENSILKTDSGSYTIQKLIGTGSSCAVYFARRTEENSGAVTEHIIKEYNPSFMAIMRNENGTLVPANDTDSAAQRFEQGRERFHEACRRQTELRSEYEALKNSTVNLQHTFDANGTCYADSTSFNGCTYDAVQEKSLHDMLRRFRAIAKIVGEYHKVGYLHLDIKPENILALNDTKELVMMFDFDSVVPMSEINGTTMLSCSRSWAAPELERGDRSSISPATDLYAIGEMLFERIMGRHSSFMEHRSFSKYSFDSRSELFRNIDPRVFALLTDVFRKTLNSSPARRYSSADELIEALDKLIRFTRPETQYLRSNLPVMDVFFTGREREIAEIHEVLSQQSVVFLSGVGGIGKSELARHYAMQYSSCYDTFVFAHYQKPSEDDPESGVLRMLTNDQEVSIVNFRRFDGENNVEYFERKLNKLGELCSDSGERVLFILDNMDTMDDADLDRLLSVGCRMIVTTRCDFREFYRQINVGTLVNARDIFRHYYTSKMDEEQLKAEAEILEYFEYHTQCVELAARSLVSGRKKPTELMEMLGRYGISQSGQEKVRVNKDAALANATMFEHIRMLFDVSGLTEDEKYVMANMSLLPVSGMPEEDFYQLCQLESYNEINRLKDNGWLRRFLDVDSSKDGEVYFIALHPVVADAAMELLKEKPERAECMLHSINQLIESTEYHNKNYLQKGIMPELTVVVAERIRKSEIVLLEAATLLISEPEYWAWGGPDEENMKCAAVIFDKLKDNEPTERMWDIAIYFSERFGEYAIKYSKQLYGEIHKNTAESYSIYAMCIGEFGEFDETVVEERKLLYDHALEIYKRLGDDYKEDWFDTFEQKITECYHGTEKIDGYKYLLYYAKEELNDRRRELRIYENLTECYEEGSEDNIKYENKCTNLSKDLYDHYNGGYGSLREILDSPQKMLTRAKNAYERLDLEGNKYTHVISDYAEVCGVLGDIKKCNELYDVHMDYFIRRYGPKHMLVAAEYASVGLSYRTIYMYAKAQEYNFKALKIYSELHMCEKEIEIIQEIAYCYSRMKQYDDALIWYNKALNICIELDKQFSIGRVSHYMADVYYEMNRYEEAMEWYTKALDIYVDCNSDYWIGCIFDSIGHVYSGLEKFDDALVWYNKSLDIGIAEDNKKIQYWAYYSIGIDYLDMGNIQTALENLYKADSLCEACMDEYYDIFVSHLRYIAFAYFKLGKDDDALSALEQMLNHYFKKYEFHPRNYAYGLFEAAQACKDITKLPEHYWFNVEYAEKYLRKAYECYTKNNIICDDFFDCVNELADLLLNLKRYDEAEQLMLQWVEQSPENHELRSTLSELYDAIGKPELAEKYRIKE